MKKLYIFVAMMCATLAMMAETIVEMKTTLGDVKFKLYDDTPLHRDNFVKLVNEGYYDGVLFHRVIRDFMVQAGDPNSKDPNNTQPLGTGSPDYTIPAEINYPTHFHKRGALAAARTNNPQKRSSGSQFYIVTGRKFDREDVMSRALNSMRISMVNNLIKENEEELRKIQATEGKAAVQPIINGYIEHAEKEITSVPEVLLETYSEIGGTPHLDGDYTVFGEVIEGLDVVEKIENVETGEADLPVEEVRIISMKVEK